MPARDLELIPLGTGGFIPWGRHTMSFLLARPDSGPGSEQILLLDAGSGVARLLDPALAARIAPLARLDVLLTHYHVDHVIGLTYLPGVVLGMPVRIHAPGPPLVDFEARAALRQLISPPLFPLDLETFPCPLEIVDIKMPNTGLTLLGLPISVRRQDHPGGSLGVRFGDRLAYVTDTAADPRTITFAQGVDTLLHEVWVSDREAAASDPGAIGHAAAGRVAEIAHACGCRRLLPIHHHPRRDEGEVEELARTLADHGRRLGAHYEVHVPIEGQSIRL